MADKVSHHGTVTTIHSDSKSEISGKPTDTAVGWMKTDNQSDSHKNNKTSSILSGLKSK